MDGNNPIPPHKSAGDIQRKRKRPPDEILREVIQAQAGIVLAIAKTLDVAPRTVRGWRERSPKVRAMFDAATLASIDLAESQLLKLIQRGNTAAVIFYLKVKGGWRERAEVEITSAGQARPAVAEAVEFAKRVIAAPGGGELVSRLLAIAAGRNPDAPLQ